MAQRSQIPLGRRLLAEFLGTALLMAFGTGAAISGAPLLAVAFAFGLTLATLIMVFGPVSDAHLNPQVTLVLAWRGHADWRDVGPYIAAQLAGGIAGTALHLGMFGADVVRAANVGATELAPGVGLAGGIVAEAAFTYVLVLAIAAFGVHSALPAAQAGLGIGLSLVVGVIVVGPLTGGAFNIARTLGPLVGQQALGLEARWDLLPVYLLGPLIGAVAGLATYELVGVGRTRERVTVD